MGDCRWEGYGLSGDSQPSRTLNLQYWAPLQPPCRSVLGEASQSGCGRRTSSYSHEARLASRVGLLAWPRFWELCVGLSAGSTDQKHPCWRKTRSSPHGCRHGSESGEPGMSLKCHGFALARTRYSVMCIRRGCPYGLFLFYFRRVCTISPLLQREFNPHQHYYSFQAGPHPFREESWEAKKGKRASRIRLSGQPRHKHTHTLSLSASLPPSADPRVLRHSCSLACSLLAVSPTNRAQPRLDISVAWAQVEGPRTYEIACAAWQSAFATVLAREKG